MRATSSSLSLTMSDIVEAVQWRASDHIIAVRTRSGRVLGEVSSLDLGADSWLDLVEYQPLRRTMKFVTHRDSFEVQVGSVRNPAPVRDRPVIYLDQNHWSTISKALHAPNRIRRPEERWAAVTLLRMALAGRVILPISAAHMSETSAWTNDEARYELALTILGGAGGWQMRDPLEIRAAEFRTAIADFSGFPRGVMPSVFTLEPYAALDTDRRSAKEEPYLDKIPGRWLYAYRATLSNVVFVSCMLGQDFTPRSSLGDWLARVQGFADWIANERGRTKEQRRRSAEVFAFADVQKEVTTAAFERGATPAEMSKWVMGTWDSASLGGPAISLFRSVMIDKFLAGNRWEDNDLTDLMYLCTAAGYADHVVGERRTIALLEQSKRRIGSKAVLHRDLVSLVRALASAGVLTREYV